MRSPSENCPWGAKTGIYVIVNLQNGKRYVGQTVGLFRHRWGEHLHKLRKGKHNRILQNAYNKYGADSFAFSVLEYTTVEELTEKEQWWMDVLRPEYNARPAAASNLGFRHTEESKAKLSAYLRKYRSKRPETGASISAGKRGVPQTEAHKAALSAVRKAKGFPRARELAELSAVKMRRPVDCLSETGEVVATYPSLKAASQALGMFNCGGIHRAIRKGQRCSGYRWRYHVEIVQRELAAGR